LKILVIEGFKYFMKVRGRKVNYSVSSSPGFKRRKGYNKVILRLLEHDSTVERRGRGLLG